MCTYYDACGVMGCVFGVLYVFILFKQKTAYEMRISDWSSDVCSSDLGREKRVGERAILGVFRRIDFDRQVRPAIADQFGIRREILARKGCGIHVDFAHIGHASHDPRRAHARQGVGRIKDRRASMDFRNPLRSEEHTSELQSIMRNSYAVL